MKKKIILIVTILAVLITLICIPKATYQKIFGTDEDIQIENIEKDFITMFVVNDKQMLVGVKVYLDNIDEDIIKQKWDILTSNMNLLPVGYSSPITPSTILNDYEIKDNVLIMDVSEEIVRSSGRLAIESLAWNFCNDQIEEVVLKNEDSIINNINDCTFTKISKKIGTNFDYETSYLFESNYSTLVFYEEDEVIPVTYFYKGIDDVEFIMSKIFDYNSLEVINYKFEFDEQNLVISFDENFNIDDLTKKTISETVALNFDIDSITVVMVDKTIYEQTFVEVS